jgi:spermidine synthase
MPQTPETGLALAEQVNAHDVYYHGVAAVAARERTPFQHLEIVESRQFGKMLLLDGDLQFALSDEFLYHEPLVHPACLQAGEPESALILGGGDGAAARELLRWKSMRRVVLVDIDEKVVDLCRNLLPELHQGALDDPRVEVVAADAREYAVNCRESFEIIISDLTTPSEGGPSEKLFEPEFLAVCRDLLAPGGVYATQAGSAAVQEADKLADLRSNLLGAFVHVHAYASAIPSFLAPWAFLMARTSPIPSPSAPEAVDARLEEMLHGPLRCLDGNGLVGLMRPVKHLEQTFALRPSE